jgi:hypothetical protein
MILINNTMNSLQTILDEILLDMENINRNILISNNIENINILYNKLKKYENDLHKINNTIQIITSLKNNLKLVFNNTILKKANKNNILKKIKIEEELDKTQSISYRNITNNEKFKDLDCSKIPVINISINNIDSVINTPIYFINETKEYCFKINNNLIIGNIGNIIDETDKKKEKIKFCKNKACNGVYFNKECNFLHANEVKNFPNYSWKYINKNKMGKFNVTETSNNKLTSKYDNENTRHIGSLESLHEDIVLSDINEKKLRNKQLMHDILLYQILSKYLS